MALPLSRQLGERLRTRGLTIATAESCTGGALAAALTALAARRRLAQPATGSIQAM